MLSLVPSRLSSGSSSSLLHTMGDPDHKYHLLGPAVDTEEFRKRPLLLQVDDTLMSLFAVLEVRREAPRQRWGLGFRQTRVYSLLFGLALVFLIAASYVLASDRSGLMLAPCGFGNVAAAAAANANATVRDYEQIKLVLKAIEETVDFSSTRRKPTLRELMDKEPHLFSVVPPRFLPGLKNPCWYQDYHGNGSLLDDPYHGNLYSRYSRRFRSAFQQLRASFRSHLVARDGGRRLRLRCLPFFYIVGQPKCGTTDLYDRLRRHPQVQFTTFKEPHWWTRKRFGLIRLSERRDRFPVEDYLDLLDQAAHQIQDQNWTETGSTGRDLIIGEASASTMWDNNAWSSVYETVTEGEPPPVLVQDYVHALQPRARVIAMFRDPVERLYSDYLYFGNSNKSASDFHDRVLESLLLFQRCVSRGGLRPCVYNATVNQAMPVRLHIGLYVVFLQDWLSVFGPDQILVLRLEDHAHNTTDTMERVFSFLSLGPLSEQLQSDITRIPASNTRRAADRTLGPMLVQTRDLLRTFYRPFNHRLADALQDHCFLWDS